MTRDPTREEVLSWLAERPSRVAEDAINRWWPHAKGRERTRHLGRVRVWVHRSKAEAKAAQDASQKPETEKAAPVRRGIVVEDRHAEPGKLDRIPWFERHLGRLEAVFEDVLQTGDTRMIIQVSSEMRDVRKQLDDARGAEKVVELVRSPATVAAEVEKRAKRIAELASKQSEAQAEQVARERNL